MLESRHISLQMGNTLGRLGSVQQKQQSTGTSFQVLLEKSIADAAQPTNANEVGALRFSKHAQKRLASRNIELSDGDIAKIENAVDIARRKGGRDSLVLMGDLALVVSVKNNTVITAVDENSSKENVFTNIDSAVIAR